LEFSHTNEASSEAVRIVCESVAEISSGLISDCTVVESCHWNLKLAAICTWRTLASYAAYSGNDISLSPPNCNLIQSLPHWNFTFYFRLVMQNKWTKYFVEVFQFCYIDLHCSIFHRQTSPLGLFGTACSRICLVSKPKNAFFHNTVGCLWCHNTQSWKMHPLVVDEKWS